MKRILLMLVIATASVTAFAQKESESEDGGGGFRKDMLFTGGTVNLSFSNYGTVLGATPQLGYSVASWLDAGILFGFTYTGQRDDANNKFRQTIFTPGAFVRLFPVNFLFASAQFEHNIIKQKVKYNTGDTYKYPGFNVNSLLVGLGYSSAREGRNSMYYYFSVSVDILQNPSSPYTDRYNNLLPVVNAGFNIPLFQGSRR